MFINESRDKINQTLANHLWKNVPTRVNQGLSQGCKAGHYTGEMINTLQHFNREK